MDTSFYDKLSGLDITIIIGYLIFVVLLGLYFGSKHKDAEDYFLAGRSLTWPLIGFSLFASNMSSNTLVGLTGSGFKDGFSVFSYEWMAVFVLIIFAVFLLPYYLKNKIFTVPEYLEKRYSYFSRAFASGIAIVLNIFVDVAATLYAGGVLIQLVFPQFELWQIIVVLSIIAGLYTISGGLSAVVYTDAIQAVILILGSCLITYIAWDQSGGFAEVMKITDPTHMDIIKSASDESLPWPALIGVFLLGFYFWGTNQYITQRTLASKSKTEGQWGAMFAGLLKLSILFIMIFPGVFARVLYPDWNTEEMDKLYPTMLFDLLPNGLLGLVVAGFIAALMSSIDSGLNSVSTLFTMDFYTKLRPGKTQEELLKVGRWVTLTIMIIATAWAPQIVHFDKLWDYLQAALSWFCPPVLAMFIMGLFWKGANSKGALWAVIVGVPISIYAMLTSLHEFFPGGFGDALGSLNAASPHFLYMTVIHFVICCLAIVFGSKTGTGKSAAELTNVVWTPAEYQAETAEIANLPWYKNYRYQGLALVIIVIIILLIY